MDIKKIILEDFRIHKKIEVELGKVTVVMGPNGSGKSSIIESVATVLIGENTWTQRDGISLSDLIRKGAKQATVTLVGRRSISRVIKPKGSQLVLDSKEPLTQAMLLGNLKTSAEQVRAALIPQSFLSMGRQDQKKTIFDLLSPKFTLASIEEYVPKETETWKKLAKRWREDHPEDTVDLDALFKFVYEARRAYKAKGKASPENPRQKELIDKLNQLSQEIAKANFENERIRIDRETLAELPRMEARSNELKAKAGNLEAAAKKVEDLENDLLEAEKNLSAAEAVRAQAQKEVDLFGEIETKGGKVKCPISLDCPHDEKVVKAKKDLAKGKEIAETGKIMSMKERIRQIRQALQAAKAELKKCEELAREIAWLDQEIGSAKLIIEREEIDVEKLKAERKAVEEELARISSAPSPDAKVVDELDAIVEALNVGGIKTAVIRQSIADLEKEANESLSRFGDWSIRFFSQDEFSPTILSRGGERLLGELSEGERALVSLVLQDTFARRSGLNMVIVDNIDLLDERACKGFFEAAWKLPSKILVGAANATFVPKIDGQKFVELKGAEADIEKARDQKAKGEREAKPPIEDLL